MRLWQETFGQAQSKWQLAGWLLAFSFPVFALVVDKAASTIYAIFFLAGLWLLIRGRHEKPDPLLRWVLIAFAAYFLVGVLSFFLGEQTRLGEKLLGRDIRFLGAIAACFALSKTAIPRLWTKAAIALAGILGGTAAFCEVFLQGEARAGGETISIVFGHLSTALLLATVVLAVSCADERKAAFLAASFGGLVAVLLTQTRGAWVALIVVGSVLGLRYMKRFDARWSVVFLAIVIAVAVAFPLSDRIGHGFRSLQKFLNYEDVISAPESRSDNDFCLDHREFLEWLKAEGIQQGTRPVDIDVLDGGPAIYLPDGSCNIGAFLRFSNSGEETAWLFMPERSTPPQAAGHGALLVRGEGIVRLPGDDDSRIPIKAKQFQIVNVGGSESGHSRHIVMLRAGDQLDVVPVETYPGEYAYPFALSSLPARLYMWEAAIEELVNEPLLGHGVGAYPDILARRAINAEGPWQITRFDHAHNEILTVAAERGIIGLITLFGVYAAPFWLFWRRRDVFGHAGMAFVASIFISGLTETIFNHSLGITYYCMLVLLLATAPRESPGESASQDMPSDKLI